MRAVALRVVAARQEVFSAASLASLACPFASGSASRTRPAWPACSQRPARLIIFCYV